MIPAQYRASLNETVTALPRGENVTRAAPSGSSKRTMASENRSSGRKKIPAANSWDLQLFKPIGKDKEHSALLSSGSGSGSSRNPPKMGLPVRLTMSIESSDVEWHNAQRASAMKQSEFQRNYQAWKPFYYGNPNEVESHKKKIREMLQSQIAERQKRKRETFDSSFEESLRAREQDKRDTDETLEQLRQRKIALLHFSRDNKKLMEERWLRQKEESYTTKRQDRQMRVNPINWTYTLK